MTVARTSATRRVVVERDVSVQMRDGAILRGDLYRPDDAAPCTVLLQRTPYDRRATRDLGSMLFRLFDALDAGYAVFVQDVRGRHGSDGEWRPFVHEASDGYDTIEWIAAQPWCDGNVAIFGASYPGIAALHATFAAPPHLRTVVAYLTGTNCHEGFVYSGGAFELAEKAKWVASLARNDVHRLDRQGALAAGERENLERGLDELTARPLDVLRRLPARSVLAGASRVAPYWHDWLEHPGYDEFWAAIDVTRSAHLLSVPILHIAGWYDAFLGGHLALQRALMTEGPQSLRSHHRFIIGPWDHEAYVSMRPASAGVRNFGPSATGGPGGFSSRVLDWFERWTRCSGSPPARDAAVRYFLIGPDIWRDSSEWPPAGVTTSTYFLDSGGHANTRHGDGALRSEPVGVTGVDRYVYDPRDPVPTTGGRHAAYALGAAGVQDQREVEDRDDVLVYTSDPLRAPLMCTGPVRVELFVSTDAVTTDFTAKLVDVDQDGRAWNVAEGIVRHAARDANAITTVSAVVVDLLDIAYQFDIGHRVRIEISSSNFPRFDRNPNATVPVCDATDADLRLARQQVHHGPLRPSRLVLSVLPDE